jgi:hypothetical protein
MSEYFLGSKKGFEILANLGLDPLILWYLFHLFTYLGYPSSYNPQHHLTLNFVNNIQFLASQMRVHGRALREGGGKG